MDHRQTPGQAGFDGSCESGGQEGSPTRSCGSALNRREWKSPSGEGNGGGLATRSGNLSPTLHVSPLSGTLKRLRGRAGRRGRGEGQFRKSTRPLG